ncbi:MAG: ABC transporter permease [Anaerolineae bacterium]|nr:ABC transporter permease [Anaerolineae bacterium]
MTFAELLSTVFENLGRRKGRVTLTAMGVVIGTASVVVLVSLGIGLQRSTTEQMGAIGSLTQIQVYPGSGDSGPGMVVMKSAGGGSVSVSNVPSDQKLLTDVALRELAELPGVTAVIPQEYAQGGGMFSFEGLEGWGNTVGIGVKDMSVLGLTAEAGTLELSHGTAVIGHYVPRNFFDPRQRMGQEQPEPPDLLGKQLTQTLEKWTDDGSGGGESTRKMLQFRVVGIIAESGGEYDYSIHIPLADVTAINEWALGRRISRAKEGYSSAIVQVADVNQALDITAQITEMGYQAYTPQQFIQGLNSVFLIIQAVFGGIGAISLLVAAIGIANTMTMAILERTREIGLLKAIGATNQDVLSIFLGEAAGIGFIGGLGGVLIGWLGGQIINVLLMAYMVGQATEGGGPPPSMTIYTPLWLSVFSLVFATLVGLLSGLYPAMRAATLVPVTALKYE